MRKDFAAVCPFVLVLLFSHLPCANARQSSTPQQTGYIRLVPDIGTKSPAGVAVFGLRTGGVLITETGVPATTTIQSGRIFAETGGAVNTGMAMANLNNKDVIISFYFTDGLGRDFGAGSFVIAANHQIAAFLNESPFKLAVSLTGTFTFSSSKPIAAIALRTLVNERNEVLTTTVPLSTLGNGFGGTTLLVPYFAGGAGSGMQIVLLNPGDTPLSGKVQFFGQGSTNVSPQLVKVTVGGVLSATFNYTVPPRSAFRIATQQPRTGAQIGLARIVPALLGGTPSSLAIFSYQTGGITVSVASVPALPPAKASRMYIESSGIFGQLGSIQSGMTISNPAETVNVQLSVMNLDGTPTGLSTSMDLAAGAQIAKLGNELFPQLPSSFRGILRVNAPSPLVVVDFRGKYNERGDLLVTATPPYDESSAPLPEVYFPHFISGEGYSTQLILVSTGSAQTGSLQLVAQDGSVLPGTILQPVP